MNIMLQIEKQISQYRERDPENRLPACIAIDVDTGYQVLEKLKPLMPTYMQHSIQAVLLQRNDERLREHFLDATLDGVKVVIADVMVSGRQARAEQLLRDMYEQCSKNQRIDQHSPYRWGAINPELMLRLREFTA